jgi:hypothetical protein
MVMPSIGGDVTIRFGTGDGGIGTATQFKLDGIDAGL